MNWFDWTILSWFGVNAVACVALIGQQRKPITPGGAAVAVILYAGLITALVLTR